MTSKGYFFPAPLLRDRRVTTAGASKATTTCRKGEARGAKQNLVMSRCGYLPRYSVTTTGSLIEGVIHNRCGKQAEALPANNETIKRSQLLKVGFSYRMVAAWTRLDRPTATIQP